MCIRLAWKLVMWENKQAPNWTSVIWGKFAKLTRKTIHLKGVLCRLELQNIGDKQSPISYVPHLLKAKYLNMLSLLLQKMNSLSHQCSVCKALSIISSLTKDKGGQSFPFSQKNLTALCYSFTNFSNPCQILVED